MIVFWVLLVTIGGIVALLLLYLLVVATIPGVKAPAIPLEHVESTGVMIAHGSRTDVSFPVGKVSIGAWFHLPDGVTGQAPCIVMAHGLGATKNAGLDTYARRFVEAGFAVLAFDYRHFGQSGGEPRQLIWIPSQLEDYAAAVAYARGRPEIDRNRIALWGTSLSGGHVIVAAARDHEIACAVAQCPALDGHAAAHANYAAFGFRTGARLIMHGQRDLVRSWLGLSPHKIPIAGRGGSIALMPAAEAYEAFCRLAPEGFLNEACARVLIRQDKYRPVKQAHKVRCPVLLSVCDRDRFLPASAVAETVDGLGDLAELRHYSIGHFDIYFQEHFESAVYDQIVFFSRHLLSEDQAAATPLGG